MDDYALIDAGDGRRLEQLGHLVVDRPAPGAAGPRRDPGRWRDADLRFEPGRGWGGRVDAGRPWPVHVADLTLELRATASGGLGLYPEHAGNLAWLEAAIGSGLQASASSPREARRPSVLNLFAHTGLATLAAARAGAAVAHVDAARSSVAWARRNAALSGLADRPVRWLVDDAPAFVEREARRGRRYDGFIIDPPSAGHGRAGRWTLRDDLGSLVGACAAVAADDAFVLLTAHSTGLTGEELAAPLLQAFGRRPGEAEIRRLTLAAASGAALDLGWAVRLGGSSRRNTAP